MDSDNIKENLKCGKIVLVDSRAIFPKTPLALGFKVAKWKDSENVVEERAMCIKCEEWVNVPKNQGTNVLKRHMDKCGFHGYAFLSPTDLATLIGNCVRLGGFKIKTDDLRKAFESYPVITKHVM